MLRFAVSKGSYTSLKLDAVLQAHQTLRSHIHQTLVSQRIRTSCIFAMGKRKSQPAAISSSTFTIPPIQLPSFDDPTPPAKRRASQRNVSQSKSKPDTGSTNPDRNANVLDAPEALRASPDASEDDERIDLAAAGMDVDKQVKEEDNDSPLSDLSDVAYPAEAKKTKPKPKPKASNSKKNTQIEDSKTKPAAPGGVKKESTSELQFLDPEAEGDEEADEEEIQAALSRPPPVNSDYLPLPWKGRLGYVSFRHEAPFAHRLRSLRLVYAHIFASRIHPSSVLEPVALRQSWKTVTL